MAFYRLQDCHILPSTIPKVKVPTRNAFLVPLLLKSSVSILDDSKPPSEGDLLRFSLVSDCKKSALIFGYIQKIVNEGKFDFLLFIYLGQFKYFKKILLSEDLSEIQVDFVYKRGLISRVSILN